MRRYLIQATCLAVIASSLAACAGQDKITIAQITLISTCGGIGNSLEILAPLNKAKKLSPAVVADIDKTIAITKPICDQSKDLPKDATGALDFIKPFALKLVQYAAGVGG